MSPNPGPALAVPGGRQRTVRQESVFSASRCYIRFAESDPSKNSNRRQTRRKQHKRMSRQNPYAAPVTSPELEQTRSGRSVRRVFAGTLVCLLSLVPGLTACFGIFHVNNRGGWQQEGIQLVIVLLATSMFFVASIGLGLLGVGILLTRRRWSVYGWATFAMSIAGYFSLFAISR